MDRLLHAVCEKNNDTKEKETKVIIWRTDR